MRGTDPTFIYASACVIPIRAAHVLAALSRGGFAWPPARAEEASTMGCERLLTCQGDTYSGCREIGTGEEP